MLDSIATDIVEIVRAVFLGGDTLTSVIAVVVALVAGFSMKSLGKLVPTTIAAMAALAVVNFGRIWLETKALVTAVNVTWNAFMDMTVAVFLIYFIAFSVAIIIAYGLRAAFDR